MDNQKVNEFAKENGYLRAEYLGEWRDFKCYEPIWSDDDSVYFVGLPLVILEDASGNLRMSTPSESMERIDEME